MPSWSLSTTLSLLVALIVTLVVSSVSLVVIRALERDIDLNLVQTAQLACQSIVDDLTARSEPFDPQDLRDGLHDLLEADPTLDALSILHRDGDDAFDVVASTSTEEHAETLDLSRLALLSGRAQERQTTTTVLVVRPVPRHPGYTAAATVGLESLLQARRRASRTAVEFALPTILVITALSYLMLRSVVGSPVHAILQTMRAAAQGEQARTPVLRRDELGTIAVGLNEMLDRLDVFTQSLQDRVEEATRDLSARNAELAENQSQLLILRESLARAERVAALGQVAANVAHQAGTPLNLVSGYVQMLRDDPGIDERTRTRLGTIDGQIQQVISVLRTFLDRARRPAGMQPVAIADMIGHIREIAEPQLRRSGIRLRVEIARVLPLVRADAMQMEMALLNVVKNGVDAMPEGGVLTIRASAEDNQVRVEIGDTGPGIAPDVVDRLFDPWVSTKPAGQGSGLGLAIVRDVVLAHGGTVSAVNGPTGAQFIIELPALPV
jgi:signal transduction histidine kinase